MGTVLTYEPTIYYYTYGAHPPALRIRPGETVETCCVDSDNVDARERPLPREQRQPGEGLLEANPVTGPFFVEGAEPGDTLTVHLDAIELDRPRALGAVHSHLGVLGDDVHFVGPTGLKPPIEGRTYNWFLDIERYVARLDLPRSARGSIEIPTHPFLGCMGVAPRWGEFINTVDAGHHGGNLDCLEVCQGATIHLPVNVPGGLLMFGDTHAAQGDGEIAGGALETTSRVRFTCGLIKGQNLRRPRIVRQDALVTVASGRPLLDMFRVAWVEMILWLESEYGYERWDALHVLSQVGQARPCCVAGPSYTVVVRFPRRYADLQ